MYIVGKWTERGRKSSSDVCYCDMCVVFFFFFFKQRTAYELLRGLVGSEICIRDNLRRGRRRRGARCARLTTPQHSTVSCAVDHATSPMSCYTDSSFEPSEDAIFILMSQGDRTRNGLAPYSCLV